MNSNKKVASYCPTIALSARWQTYPNRFQWLKQNGFALEYSPNPEALNTLPEHVGSFVQSGIPVRYHAFFPGCEIGHRDADIRETAMRTHIAALEAMHGYGQSVITVHIGLNPSDEIEPEAALKNLTRLVKRAGNLGITICLENLRRGMTSQPEILVDWARKSGAMITFDIGHAISSQRVKDGELTVIEFLDSVTDRLQEVHMYEQETDRHHPPQDMNILGPIVDRLLTTGCSWWTIELDDPVEALATRDLLLAYMRNP